MTMATSPDTQSPALHVADSHDLIRVHGARENNLKNISLDIPRRQITVFTGVSGSGKSSLVFDTIAAESQRLINETFSTYVQMFLPRYGQPDAEALHNLSTAIIVDQQPLGGNPRSTLGTATDVYTLFRVLFARVGAPKVPHALALSFNPRYRDFPFAPLTAAALPFPLLSFVAAPVAGARSRAETIGAAMLVPCAVFIIWNETLANWQALWFATALALVAFSLLRARVAPG